MDEPLPTQSMRARDIDLLILEELAASHAFRQFILRSVSAYEDLADSAAIELRSVRINVESSGPGAGETDIELIVIIDGDPVAVLIENKIYAPLQPDQLPRYRQRADGLTTGTGHVLLLAPSNYPYDATFVDGHLTYEQVRDHLHRMAELSGGGFKHASV